MTFSHLFTVSTQFIKVFNKNVYENAVLDLMNQSERVFPYSYRRIEEQANGECDFVDTQSSAKFDAKLPFYASQIEMLTCGKRHKSEIEKWISEMQEEAADFNPRLIRDDPSYDITQTKLYLIMEDQIRKDKSDENIVFFIPFPITWTVMNSIYLQFASDYLRSIYDRLCKDINMDKREIYAIYPSSEKNTFVLRNLKNYVQEFIYYDGLNEYFTYELVNIR